MTDWKGPALWFLWGALMGFGFLGVLSIGLPFLIVGVLLLFPLSKGGRPGAWMALVGAATPWFAFALEGYLSPDCIDGMSTISPSGDEQFTCRAMASPDEFMPFLIASSIGSAIGVAMFIGSLRLRPPRGPAVASDGLENEE
ncbi:MAG TPA: hypothetical protein VNC78_07115 [Actinomycetota bacterium]|nr:hypothetical protein [Actinomycetota bacterium]